MNNIITKIEMQKRDKNRVNIYVDDEFSFACSCELIYYHDLKKGIQINKESLKSIVDEDNFIKAKNYGLKILERSFKTEHYVRQKLKDRDFSDKIINKTIIFLKEYNFLNDEKYTQLFIKEKIRSYGRNKIKYMLLNKGIEEALFNTEISNLDSSIEEKSAYSLANKKYNLLVKSEKNPIKIYKKIWDCLLGRGYKSKVIETVINKIKIENPINFNKTEENIVFDEKEVYFLAQKRYNTIIKSETDYNKIYRRLGSFLLRKGYKWEQVKKVLEDIIN